jgi:hypothetical protein
LSTTSGGTSPLHYLWNNGATTSSISVSQTGNYSVTITDAHGCHESLGPVSETFDHPLQPVISGRSAYCWNDSVVLTMDEGNQYTYTWIVKGPDHPGIYTGPNLDLPPVSYSTVKYDTIFGIVTSIFSGCKDTSLPFRVTINPAAPAPALISYPSSRCVGSQPVVIKSIYGGNPYPVYWSNGFFADSITVDGAGVYSAYAVDSLGCPSVSESVIINAGADFSQLITGCYYFCNTDSEKIYGPTYTTGNVGYAFQWLLNGRPIAGPNGTQFNYYPVTAPGGVYQLVVTTPNGCTDTSVGITYSFHACPTDSIKGCCCCGYVAYIDDSIYCKGTNISGHAMYDFSAYIYYPDSPSRVQLTAPWGLLTNITYIKDSLGILYRGRFTNTTDTTADFCVKWQVKGLNGLDSCSVTSCHQLPSCLSPCELSSLGVIGTTCQADINNIIYDSIRHVYDTTYLTEKLLVISINYLGTPGSTVTFTADSVPTDPTHFYQNTNLVGPGSQVIIDFFGMGYFPKHIIVTATIHDSIFGNCIIQFPLDTSCVPIVKLGYCVGSPAMILDSCIGHDSSGHPIVHFTIPVTNPSSSMARVFIDGSPNLNQSSVMVFNDTIYPGRITYITGTFDDTATSSHSIVFIMDIINMQGDTILCADSLLVPNQNPCAIISDSANIFFHECGYDSSSAMSVEVLIAYVHYTGTPGSPVSFSSNVPGQIVSLFSPFVLDSGSALQLAVFDPSGFTSPFVITMTIHDPIFGVHIIQFSMDSICRPFVLLDSCGLTYSFHIDSCIGQDSLGHPIIRYTLIVHNPVPVAGNIILGANNLDQSNVTQQSNILNPSGYTTIVGTIIDTLSPSDVLDLAIFYSYGGNIDTICNIQFTTPNAIPCGVCPTIEPQFFACGSNTDSLVRQSALFCFITWNGPDNTPFTVTSDCPNVGVQLFYSPDSTFLLMNPGSHFSFIITDTFPYAKTCHLIFSTPNCHVPLLVTNLDTCLSSTEFTDYCDSMSSAMKVDSCLGIDSTTGNEIFSYTLTINRPPTLTNYTSFEIFPNPPIVRFTTDSCNLRPAPATTTFQGTFEITGSLPPYISYYVFYFDSTANLCNQYIVDSFISPCPGMGGRMEFAKMFLYPNPTGTTSTLVYEIDEEDKPDMILVSDLLGNTVMQFDDLEQKGTLVLNSEKLASSIYFVSLYQHRKPIITARWAVVR